MPLSTSLYDLLSTVQFLEGNALRRYVLRMRASHVHTAINDMYTKNNNGNVELTNLPRKINIALSPSRDDFPHMHINNVGLVAIKHPKLVRSASPQLRDTFGWLHTRSS